MLVTVTQILPDGTRHPREVNTDLVEEVGVSEDHLEIVLESGHFFNITETKSQWDALVKGS